MGVFKAVGGAIAKDYLKYKFENSKIRDPESGMSIANGAQINNAVQKYTGRSLPGFKNGGSVIGRVASNPAVRIGMTVASGNAGRIGAAARSGRTLVERNKVPDMTKMANVQKALNEMNELQKEAELNLKDSIKHHGVGVGMSLVAPAVIAAGRHVYNKLNTEKTWKKVIEKNPEFNTPEGREQFEVLQQFSPAIASNPTTARSYLQRTTNTGGIIPHEFVKDLVNVQDTKNKGGFGAQAADIAKNQRFGDSMRAVADSKRHDEDSSYRKAKDEREFNYRKDKDDRDFGYRKYKDDEDFNYRANRDKSQDQFNKNKDDRDFAHRQKMDEHRVNMDLNRDYRDQTDFDDRQNAKASKSKNIDALKQDIFNSYDDKKDATKHWLRIKERLLTSGK